MVLERIYLTREERKQLDLLCAQTEDTPVRTRASALRYLHSGFSVDDTAELWKVSRRTVYNLINRFYEDPSLSLIERLSDKPRSGRPPKSRSGWTEAEIKQAIEIIHWLLEHEPDRLKIQLPELFDIKKPRNNRGDDVNDTNDTAE
jgi:transposase